MPSTIWLETCSKFHGELRLMAGDAFLATFNQIDGALSAIEYFTKAWIKLTHAHDYYLPSFGCIDYGEFYTFRSHLFGDTINNTFILSKIALASTRNNGTVSILLSNEAYKNLTDEAHWLERLTISESASAHSASNGETIYSLLIDL